MAFVYAKGCSPFYEKKAHSTVYEKRADAKAKTCLNCTKERCDKGSCEVFRKPQRKKKEKETEAECEILIAEAATETEEAEATEAEAARN